MKRNLHAGKKLSGGFSLNAFTDDECYEIHLATLEVLEKTGVFVIDHYTGELRKPTKKDVADAAKLADYLSEVDVYERAVGAHEVHQEVAQIHNAEASFNNTSKHLFMGAFSGYQLDKIVEMATVIAGGKDEFKQRPIFTTIT